MGRPSKRTPEVEAAILRALKLGLDFTTASEIVGITSETLRAWRVGDEDFSADCKRAKGEGKQHVSACLMKNINKGNVTAQIFWLKTRCSEEFREKVPEGATTADDFAKAFAAFEAARTSLPGNNN